MRTAEELAKKGLHFVGDVKTGTTRFVAKTSLEAATPRENGSWATWTSELKLGGDQTIPIFAVSHRRGESIHGFISTCGTTLPGHSHYAYFEDDEERTTGTSSSTSFRAAARACSTTSRWRSLRSTGTTGIDHLTITRTRTRTRQP